MKTVLVVENDKDTRDIYCAVLQHHRYRVLTAADGREGVEIAQTQAPDLIVMNLSMPKLDGLSATSLLRGDPRTAQTPIIACTGFVREDGEDMADDAGCDLYLEKPCEPSRIVHAIESLIGPSTAARDGAETPAPQARIH